MAKGDTDNKAQQVHRVLFEHYGEPEQKAQRPPLDELIQTILSQNTSDTNSGRAWSSLRDRFSTWGEVAEAETEDVEEAIRVGGLASSKAPRIQQIITQLQDERGEASLEFLNDLSVEEARSYLEELPGVGPKTAACVLLFSLHKPALPVDTHVLRVSKRLGLIADNMTAEKAESELQAQLAEELYYPFHLLLIEHGRTLCVARNPRCEQCPLNRICVFYEKQQAESDTA